MDLIDSLRPGEVAVLACGGPTELIAPWGELLKNIWIGKRLEEIGSTSWKFRVEKR